MASLLLLVVACGGDEDAASRPVGSAAPAPASSGSPVTGLSPVVGQLVKLDSSGLTKVAGFSLRTDAGAVIAFRLGILENGAEFPPGHLAEHMALGTPIRAFFRLEGGERVVYRLEDTE